MVARIHRILTKRHDGNHRPGLRHPRHRCGWCPQGAVLVAFAVVLGGSYTAVAALGAGAVGAAHDVPAASDTGFTGSPSPAYTNDAPDPDLLYSGGTYYTFTTGTPLGNYIQALTDTTETPASGWQPFTGEDNSSALPNPPTWETLNTQSSPGVFFYDGHWVMFYDAEDTSLGHFCLSVATTSTLLPPVFTDNSTGPLYCGTPGVGVLDPSPFVDPATGHSYLLWKSNDGGGSAAPSQIWSAQLSTDWHQHRRYSDRPTHR